MFGFYIRLCKTRMKTDLQNCNESRLTSVESRESVRFYNNRSSFYTLVWASKLKNPSFFVEIFPRGLPARTVATHGCVSLSLRDGLTRLTLMLNGCFLKLSQSISSDSVPDMSFRNTFNTPFLNQMWRWWKKDCRVPVSFRFLFCFWQNHYICLLYDDLCVFEYLERD